MKQGKRLPSWDRVRQGLPLRNNLRRNGHTVVVFEKADRLGGLLRYGIPDFKMEKHVIDRRLQQMRAEGVIFKTGIDVGKDLPADILLSEYDAVLLAVGAMVSPQKEGLLSDLGVAFDARGNVAVDKHHMTSVEKVFAAGDAKRGASLIVWAIREGRDAAAGIERYLHGSS